MPILPRSRRSRYGVGAVLLALPLAVAAVILPGPWSRAGTTTPMAGTAPASAPAQNAGQAAPTVNWALEGTATATTAESANPAPNAIDGDAGTDWCTSGWTGTLTVDLGQVRSLSDLGITLDAASPSASATIELASHGRRLAADPGR